jgi:hypothetical protein
MRAGGGKEKGSEFERYCCRRLSLYVTKGKRDDVFWRSAMSGGRATLQLKQEIVNLAQSGDMTAIAPEGYELCARCLFEYKNYANLDIPSGLFKQSGMLFKFWSETKKAALSYSKAPILIAKQNYQPSIVVCPEGLGIFNDKPILTVHRWQAEVFLFEAATQMIRRRFIAGREDDNTKRGLAFRRPA